VNYHSHVIQLAATSMGSMIDIHGFGEKFWFAGELVVAYTSWKPMSVLPCAFVVFKQLLLFTSGTCSGSVNVISAHCILVSSTLYPHPLRCSTYVIKRSSMLGQLNDLDGRIVAHLWGESRWQRYLRETESTVVLDVGGTCNLENGKHGMAVVQRLIAISHVDVELGKGVTRKPSRLD
jgi:hypothetical protein